jgi:hypothetical protein
MSAAMNVDSSIERSMSGGSFSLCFCLQVVLIFSSFANFAQTH